MSENNIPKIAVNVFLIKDNKLLLGQRKNTSGAGDWGLPGGHLEYGESLYDGAVRELDEETGIKVEALELFNMANEAYLKEAKHYLHINFIAVGEFGEPKLMEPEKCSEWKWFDLNEIPPNIFVGHRSSMEAFLNKKTFVDKSMSGDTKYLKLHI